MAIRSLNGIGEPCLVYDNVEEVRSELQFVADKLGLPIEDERVLHSWCHDEADRRWTIEVGNKLLAPLYKMNPKEIPLIPPRYWDVDLGIPLSSPHHL